MISNLLSNLPTERSKEVFETLVESEQVRIVRIVSRGHSTPKNEWCDQQEHEWVLLLKGAATLLFEKDHRVLEIKAGDHVNIPAHERHRVAWTVPGQETIWLAVFYQ
jgi:cupin 2 domain-containing protein